MSSPVFPTPVGVFVPSTERPSLPDRLGIREYTRSAEEYTLREHCMFKPCYFSRPVLRPKVGANVNGHLVYVDPTVLRKMDAYCDEGHTLYRLSTAVTTQSTPEKSEEAQVYVWNGNSRVGEWEENEE